MRRRRLALPPGTLHVRRHDDVTHTPAHTQPQTHSHAATHTATQPHIQPRSHTHTHTHTHTCRHTRVNSNGCSSQHSVDTTTCTTDGVLLSMSALISRACMHTLSGDTRTQDESQQCDGVRVLRCALGEQDVGDQGEPARVWPVLSNHVQHVVLARHTKAMCNPPSRTTMKPEVQPRCLLKHAVCAVTVMGRTRVRLATRGTSTGHSM